MGERRKWDKQPAAALEAMAFGNTAAATSDAAVDPVLEKQVQYIKMLEERNRLKKKLAAASKKETRDKQREDAFTTTFNVPTTTGGTAAAGSAAAVAATQDTVRRNKSSASLLPTRMHTQTTDRDRSRGRSAPGTTLPTRHAQWDASGDDSHSSDAKPDLAVRRAKWSKPAPGALFGVENRNGKARLYVGAEEDEVDAAPVVRDGVVSSQSGSDEDEIEEEYLEESFEEFEGDGEEEEEDDSLDEKYGESKGGRQKVVSMACQRDEKEAKDSVLSKAESKPQQPSSVNSQETGDASSSAGLSRTTTELFSIIQNLSRSKQKDLIDVLQNFQSSPQQTSDVQKLQSSISDPAVWKQVTSVLFGDVTSSVPAEEISQRTVTEQAASGARVATLTVADVMADQLKWEEEYACQMQERLLKEREAKQKALRDAEDRRHALLQQMEEEEKELERLMERKRQERLAKIKALDQEEATERVPVCAKDAKRTIATGQAITAIQLPQPESKASPRKKAKKSPRGAKLELLSSPLCPAIQRDEKGQGVVPALNLSTINDASRSSAKSTIELRVRLLSTWGGTRAVGLTQICAYDVNGGEMTIDSSAVKIYEQADGRPLPKSHEMLRTISRLFNGIAQTNNDQDMWLGRLSDHGMVEIAFEVETIPSKLCVWNYNSKMCSACTRDAEIIVGGKSVWNGSLPQGFGDEDDSICTWINVAQGAKKTTRANMNRESVQGEKGSADSSLARESAPSLMSGTPPIWLAASNSSPSLPKSSKPLDTAGAKDELLQDHTVVIPPVGSLTSRRQRGVIDVDQPDVPKSRAASTQNKSSEVKCNSLRDYAQLDEKHSRDMKRESKQQTKSAVVDSPSWDTLEHFSKTSRSRLPSAADESVHPVLTTMPDVPLPTKFVPATTSALLSELRGNSNKNPLSATQTPVPVHIPELPSGRRLKVQILDTWGDQYYVGLNGIEIYNQHGKLVTFSDPDRQVTACPSSINVLDDYDDDPRVAKNLVDGVNRTCDDFHMWLAPYTVGAEHFVTVELERSTAIAMIRVWNYNKSRAHTFRGVRHVRITLSSGVKGEQGQTIFEGEIRRAPGGLFDDGEGDGAMWCEVILFTTDVSLLKKIEANDALLQTHGEEEEEEEITSAIVTDVRASMELRRPQTADDGSSANNEVAAAAKKETRRPVTSAKRPGCIVDVRKSIDSWVGEEPQQKSPVLRKVVEAEDEHEDEVDIDDCEGLLRGRHIIIRLQSTWGDHNYIGLTQLDVLVGNHGTPLPLDLTNVDTSPRDLAALGYHADPRTLDKLVNGIGTTCDDANMWLVPFGVNQEIRIDLKREQIIYGIRVWNYNKSLEDSFRGVKQISVLIDGELISPRQTGFVLRKAPGNVLFDFDQTLRFASRDLGDKRDQAYVEKVLHPIQHRTYKSPSVKQDYEPTLYPQGFVLKLVLWSTWGDPYYVGLNGIELYDFQGKQITARPSVVTAKPHSLSEINKHALPQDDVRVPGNLLSGKNKNTWDASDAWLAPLASSLGNNQGNVVYVVFDTPIVLSLVKFWNYSKSPERGVKDVDIYLDDLLLFAGSLRKAPHGNGAQNVGRFGSKPLVVDEFSQPVLFSTNQAQVDSEKQRVYYCGAEEQDVLCINEGQVVQESKPLYRKPDPGAEGVIVDLGLRPSTAVCRK